MARHDDGLAIETMSKRRRGFQLRGPREARPTDRTRRQGAGRKARPQRSLSLRIATAVSRPAALVAAGFIERDYRR
jgi:hypothetical protein